MIGVRSPIGMAFVATVAVAIALPVSLGACGGTDSTSEDGHAPVDGSTEGASPLLDAGIDGNGDAAEPICGEDASSSSLRLLPDRFTLAYSTGISCPAPRTTAVLVNDGTTSLTVTGVTVSPQTVRVAGQVPNASTPRVVAPGEALEVPLLFETPIAGKTTARLAVSTSDGCNVWPIPATAFDGPMGISDPQMLHFGNVKVGETVTRTVVLRQVGLSGAEHRSFGATPPFALETPPAEPFRYDLECDQLSLTLSITGSGPSGPRTGELGYTSAVNGQEAVSGIPLSANIVKPN